MLLGGVLDVLVDNGDVGPALQLLKDTELEEENNKSSNYMINRIR